ncbi:MAG: 50S ribosomal protein L15 [Candidatus Nasuia deltocephalinicola]
MFIRNLNFKNKKRIGRGESSGYGKTSSRGNKGQKSRSGSKKFVFFEGGQTPLFKRLPKFGFKKIKKIFYFNLNKSNFIPFSIIDLFVLRKINFLSPNIYIKIFSNSFILKKIIFYNFFIFKMFIFFLNFSIFFII